MRLTSRSTGLATPQLGRAMSILVGAKPLRDRLALIGTELHGLRPAGHLASDEAPSGEFADRFNDLVTALDIKAREASNPGRLIQPPTVPPPNPSLQRTRPKAARR